MTEQTLSKLDDALWVITRGFGGAFLVALVWVLLTGAINLYFSDADEGPVISEKHYGGVTVVDTVNEQTLLSGHGNYIYSETKDEFTVVYADKPYTYKKDVGISCIMTETR